MGQELFHLKGSVFLLFMLRPEDWGTDVVVFLFLSGHTKKVTAFVFSDDGKTGYSSGGELVVEWNIKEQKEIS